MTQVVWDINCPVCSDANSFFGENGGHTAKVILTTDDDDSQWLYIRCSKCGDDRLLDEVEMVDILVERYNADTYADLFAMIVRTLNMQERIREQYKKQRGL